jgi:hypothetical protein
MLVARPDRFVVVRRLPALAALLVGVCLAGCGRKADEPTLNPAVPVIPAPPAPPPAPVAKPDTRTKWVYDNGWFAKGANDAWYEHNDEAIRLRGKAWEFRQVKSTDEHIELYDASRAVSLRLSESAVSARWDKDGPDAEWKVLYAGHWDESK